tara:strand:- start:12441 stop:13682 length:1242 start_codon:yes stop_codon:yes gene_type:complete
VNPSQVERIALSSIKDTSHLLYLQQEHGISETHFAFFPEEAQYIYKYTREYGEAPPQVIIEANFPDFEYTAAENFEVLAAELRKSYEARIITLSYGNARKFMDENPTEAASYMMRTLSDLTKPTSREVVELSANPLQWFDEYESRLKQRDNGDFLSTGIDPLDGRIFITAGQFIGLLADYSVGKSYFAVKMAVKFYQQGRKILFISPELSRSELMVRFHTVLGKQWGYDFSATALMWGLPTQKEQYRDFLIELEEKKNNQDIIVYDTNLEDNLTVEYVTGLIQKHNPDVVFIDSIQFVKDTSGVREGWMQLGSVCRGLKQVASSYDKIIVATNQTNAQGDSAYSREFPRYVDLLIRISNVEDSPTQRGITVDKVRSGPSIAETIEVVFDPDAGYIGDSVWSASDIDVSDAVVS